EMRLCQKLLAAALCALVVLPEPGCARTLWKRALLKMTEKYDVRESICSASSPAAGGSSGSPSLSQSDVFFPTKCCVFPVVGKSESGGRAADLCSRGAIGGCSILDWLVQPKPRWLGGNGWLLDGPEEVLQAEACSTTEDGDEPLHCPTGYECHIINPGNTAEGIPNRGQCIKLRGNPDGHNLRHKHYKEYFGSNSNNLVGYVKNQQKHLG
ncbi:WFDC1 protein, partial [Loxia leucoptera]|nr:WFDC1 protein [Loxia leucoptera]